MNGHETYFRDRLAEIADELDVRLKKGKKYYTEMFYHKKINKNSA